MRKLALSMGCVSLLLCSYHAQASMPFPLPGGFPPGGFGHLLPIDYDFILPTNVLTFSIPMSSVVLKSPAAKKSVCDQVRYYLNKSTYTTVVLACADSSSDALSMTVKLWRYNIIENKTAANCSLNPSGTKIDNTAWSTNYGIAYNAYRTPQLKVGSQLTVRAVSSSLTVTKYYTVPSLIAKLTCTGGCDNPTCTWN